MFQLDETFFESNCICVHNTTANFFFQCKHLTSEKSEVGIEVVNEASSTFVSLLLPLLNQKDHFCIKF